MNINAQNKLTLDDLIPGGKNYRSFIPKTLDLLQWNSNEYVYLKNRNTLVAVNPSTREERDILTTQQLNDALLTINVKKINRIPTLYFLPDFPTIIIFWHDNHLFRYAIDSQKVVSFVKAGKDWKFEEVCHATGAVAFTKENNLYAAFPGEEAVAITSETNPDIVNGQAVHRNEFGIEKGIFWSPKGNYVAFYRMDESMVKNYPLVDISTGEVSLQNIKYPMAGMKSHQVTVGIFDVNKQQTTFLKTGYPKDRYFTNITWSLDEQLIYIAEVNRRQDTCFLNTYNIHTGKKQATLFEETHPKYINPRNPPILFKQTDQFIWQSNRDGFNHFYLYQEDGTLIKQLTKGNWEVTEFVGFDDNEETVYFLATEKSPVEIHGYKLHLPSGKMQCLTTDTGLHEMRISHNGNYALSICSGVGIPNKIDLIDTENSAHTNILTANDPYSNYQMPEMTIGTILADDDSTTLYYRLIKPVDFDPEKKYPVIIYVYGGPGIRLVEKSWLSGSRGWDIYMAQKGYVVFSLDSRGSAKRGRDFENVIYRNLGINEAADQMKGVEFLKSLPYIDENRIGVHGWSFGGYMTVNLMLRHPDIFKVGVAGAPVIDWGYYEVMYGERYMNIPKENPDGYENTNLNNLAENLSGKLLIIHGDKDPVVVLQHSMSFLKSCIDKNTYPDYFIYPGHEHNVYGKDRVHLFEKITRYFDDFLR